MMVVVVDMMRMVVLDSIDAAAATPATQQTQKYTMTLYQQATLKLFSRPGHPNLSRECLLLAKLQVQIRCPSEVFAGQCRLRQ